MPSWSEFFAAVAAGPDRVQAYALIGTLLFLLGMLALLSRRNFFGVFMGIELILNGASLNFVAFSVFPAPGAPAAPLEGQVFSLFVIVLAAAEAAVALALALVVFQVFRRVDMARLDALRG